MAKYTKETDVLFQYSQGFRLIVPNAYKTCHTQFYSVDYPNGLAIAPSSYIVEGGKTYCPVPNQMTVKPNSIIVFAYLLEESRAITESKTVLEVWERPKPPDFVFDPTDTVTYATATELIEQMKASVAAEEARVAAESLRVTAEESRVAAEESREAAESSRVTAEESRVTAEAERESAESSRETAETSRVSAESERATAEASRVSAESSRASAEEARVTAETTRASAEESRVAAESARASAESERESAESSRTTAEASRVSAESSRASAESERQTAESARESAEETRQANESARVSAESSRASAESSRVSAEASRVSAEALRETKWKNASATAVTGDVNADVVITDSGVKFNFAIPRGLQGEKGDPGVRGLTGETGNGISSMTLVSGTHAAGTIDTYRLTFTDGTYQDFTVYNGANGEGAGDMLWEEFNNRLNPSGKNGQIAFESEVTAHTGNADIHVTSAQKTAWSAKYDKPTGGIPKTDLASAVQTSLGKADTALQQHQDISGKADVSALTAHTGDTTIHTSTAEKNTWNGKYTKPSGGIPKTDLASSVQTSLGKADSALQEHQDISALTNHVANNSIHVTTDDKTAWNAKANVFTIALSDGESGTLTTDKTYNEILEAYNSGKLLRITAEGGMLEGTFLGYTYNTFSFVFITNSTGVYITSDEVGTAPAYSLLPRSRFSDRGKMLIVDNSGNPAWAEDTKSNKPIFSQYTILTSGWSDGVYSFESDFFNMNYDIEIELDSTATESQVEAWSNAKVTSVFGTNTMKALGDVPTVDIPVIVKAVMK